MKYVFQLNIFYTNKSSKRTFYGNHKLIIILLIFVYYLPSSLCTSIKQIVDCSGPYCNEPCECFLNGVKDTNNCYKPCICKDHVKGELCDQCKEGYYNLDPFNIDGCSKCFCSNVTTLCTTRVSVFQVVSKVDNWLVSDITGSEKVKPLVEEAHPTIPDDDAPAKPYYWFAPHHYLGDRSDVYNKFLNIHLAVITPRGDRSGKMIADPPDVIIAGSESNIRLSFKLDQNSFQNEEMKGLMIREKIRLRENGWFRIDNYGNIIGPANSGDLALVLRDLKQLMIRAFYYSDQLSGVLYRVELFLEPRLTPDYSRSSTFIPTTAEMCNCPEGYSGFSCEICAPGYWKMFHKDTYSTEFNLVDSNLDRGWSCVPCQCHNHSWSSYYSTIDPTVNPNTCNPINGKCECIHNTVGSMCELCADGFHGDATIGQPNDCKPCECPLLVPTNNFSPTCVSFGDDYYCDRCAPPYTGSKCDECLDGYFGNPKVPGGKCLPEGSEYVQPFTSESTIVTNPLTSAPLITEIYTNELDYYTTSTVSPILCASDWCVSLLVDSCKEMSEPLIYFKFDDLSAASDRYSNYVKRIQSYQEQLQSSTVFIQNRHQFLTHFLVEYNFTSAVNYSVQYIENIEGKVNILLPQISHNYFNAQANINLLNKIIQKTRQTLLTLDNIEVKSASTIIPENLNIYQDGLNLVSEVRKIDLSSILRRATIESTHSAKFLAQIRFMMDIYENFESLRRKTTRLKLYSEQFESILDSRARNALINYQHLSDKTRVKLGKLVPKMEQINREIDALEFILKKEPKIIQNMAKRLDSHLIMTENLQDFTVKMANYTNVLFKHRKMHSDWIRQYKPLYVDSCVARSKQIIINVNQAQNYYQSVRESASNLIQALSVHQKIHLIINYVQTSVLDVIKRFNSLNFAFNLADLVKICSSYDAKSVQSLSFANDFQQQKFVDFKEKAVNTISKFNNVFDAHELAKKSIQTIDDSLNKMPLSVTVQSRDLIDFSQLLTSGLDMVIKKIDFLNDSLTSEEQSQLKDAQNRWQEERRRILDPIDEAKREVDRAVDMVDKVHQLIMGGSRNGIILDQSLNELRKRILLARRKASEIKISLTSEYNRTCRRSFDVETEPSTINSISLTYALSDDVKNSLLFFVSSWKGQEFMALEMIDRRIRFSWDVGKGTATLQHPMQLMSGKDFDIERWYKITINRVAERVDLSVDSIGSSFFGGSAAFSTVSPGNATVFDLGRSSRVYIGDFADNAVFNNHLATEGFKGCITDVYFDDKAVNLWNFRETSGCKGCREGPSEEFGPDTYHFDGKLSYSILPQIARYSNENYLVVLTIKTYDEDSLIFFCSDQGSRDYIAVSMVQGKVVFSFMDGPDYRLSLSSVLKYNHGEWIRISAERSDGRAILRVEDEIIDGQIDRDLVHSDLSDCLVHFGGVPPNFTSSIWPEMVFKPFKGCIKDVQIDATVLNLLAGESYGVATGCRHSPPRSANFSGQGYLELRAMPLKDHSNLSFTFNTQQSEAILVVSLFKKSSARATHSMQYYTISVINGFIEIRLNAGNGEVFSRSKKLVNDGQLHTVAIARKGRKIWITIDDTDVEMIRMMSIRHFGAENGQGLFLGGLPSGHDAIEIIKNSQSLQGTIKNLIYNGKIIIFSDFVASLGVEIGKDTAI